MVKHNKKILKILLSDYKRSIRAKGAYKEFHWLYAPNPYHEHFHRALKWLVSIEEVIEEGWVKEEKLGGKDDES